MLREIHDIKDYSFNPVLESNEKLYDTPVTLFGKPWRIMDDYWMKHVHIKITDRCNAKCPFCIEKDSYIKEDPVKLQFNLRRLISELNEQGHLATVSITGGEPFCQSEELLKLLKLLEGKRISIETNGSFELEPFYRAFSAENKTSELWFSTDWKTPSSGNPLFDERNIGFLRKSGAGWIKFVAGSLEDLDFIDEKLQILDGIETYLSPVFENGKGWFSSAEKFVRTHKNIRLQLQMHKILGIE